MKYKVVNTCVGFRGLHWEEGQIVEIEPSENPPRHFVPLENVPEKPKAEPHRTEAFEVAPGMKRGIVGGMASSLENTKIDRIMTTDKVPNFSQPYVKTSKKKDVGSVKR